MLNIVGYFLLSLFLFTGCKKEETRPEYKRPNIVFILADDQRNDVLSIAGHPIVQTPTIDKLALNGMRFTNAFVTTSICAASRASIFTGLYESKHNYTFGKDPIKKEYIQNSYPYLLKKSGYHTGFVGKFGVEIEEKDSLIPQLFDFFKPAPQNAPYFEKLADDAGLSKPMVLNQIAVIANKMLSKLDVIKNKVPESEKSTGSRNFG